MKHADAELGLQTQRVSSWACSGPCFDGAVLLVRNGTVGTRASTVRGCVWCWVLVAAGGG